MAELDHIHESSRCYIHINLGYSLEGVEMRVLVTGAPNSNSSRLAQMLQIYGVDVLRVYPVPKVSFLKRSILRFDPDISLIWNLALALVDSHLDAPRIKNLSCARH